MDENNLQLFGRGSPLGNRSSCPNANSRIGEGGEMEEELALPKGRVRHGLSALQEGDESAVVAPRDLRRGEEERREEEEEEEEGGQVERRGVCA